jgi:hypothetical protein
MTDKTTIAPAIPPEEWAAQLQQTPEERRRRLLWAKDEVDAFGYLTIHGLAALALYGQPFGFTREELEALEAYRWEWEHNAHPTSDVLLRVIDKVKALLPSSDPTVVPFNLLNSPIPPRPSPL